MAITADTTRENPVANWRARSDMERRRVIVYWLLGLGLVIGYGMLRGSTWQSSAEFHTLIEAMATMLALMVGIMALVRYYSRKSITILYIGTGFLGTALLDGYHTIVTSHFFAPYPSLRPAVANTMELDRVANVSVAAAMAELAGLALARP